MSTDSFHHQVYPGIIQGVDDGAYAILRTSSFPLAAMIIAFSLAVLSSRVMPAWIAWFGFLAGAAAVASMFVPRVGYLWLLWVAIVSVLLFLSSDVERSFRPTMELRPAPADAETLDVSAGDWFEGSSSDIFAAFCRQPRKESDRD